MLNSELQTEIKRLKEKFSGADESKLAALDGMIEQAACEQIYLRRLNEQAVITGLVKIHPDNPEIQRTLPVSAEIARHSAALTNIMDKLIKHLMSQSEEDDDELSDYE